VFTAMLAREALAVLDEVLDVTRRGRLQIQ